MLIIIVCNIITSTNTMQPEQSQLLTRQCFFQGKGVRIVAVGIGNFAKKKKFRDVLRLIAGDNVFFVDDYDILDSKGAVDDTVKIICRKYPVRMF